MDESQRVRIYAYNKVWNVENKIYAIQNIILPAPISPQEFLYFMITAGITFLLGSLIPAVAGIPFILRFLVIPYLITQFLTKKKLDGKKPQKYLMDYVKYAFSRNEYLERLQTRTGKKREKIKLCWVCGTR